MIYYIYKFKYSLFNYLKQGNIIDILNQTTDKKTLCMARLYPSQITVTFHFHITDHLEIYKRKLPLSKTFLNTFVHLICFNSYLYFTQGSV